MNPILPSRPNHSWLRRRFFCPAMRQVSSLAVIRSSALSAKARAEAASRWMLSSRLRAIIGSMVLSSS